MRAGYEEFEFGTNTFGGPGLEENAVAYPFFNNWYIAYPIVGDAEQSGQYHDASNNATGGFSATARGNVTAPFEVTPWAIGHTSLTPNEADPPVVAQDADQLQQCLAAHVEGDLAAGDLDPLDLALPADRREGRLQVVGDPVEVRGARVLGVGEGPLAVDGSAPPYLEAAESGGVPRGPGTEHAGALDRCGQALAAELVGKVLRRLVALVLVAHVSPWSPGAANGGACAPRSR